jgi:tryptophan synthase alpha chain
LAVTAQRIDTIFSTLRQRGDKAMMPFVCGGFPALDSTADVLPALERAGASIVEVGIPFSDPIADGPVIAAAMHEALKNGASPLEVFDQVASVRNRVSIGLVAMCSFSIVHRMGGPEGFCRQAEAAGFDGLIIPDAPLEESGGLRKAAEDHRLTISLLVAPTSTPERAAAIARVCTGFVYLLARAGITGETGGIPEVGGRVQDIRAVTKLPIACGFGISAPEHVRAVVHAGGADAAIVGSGLVRAQAEAVSRGQDPIKAAAGLVSRLAQGLRASPV